LREPKRSLKFQLVSLLGLGRDELFDSSHVQQRKLLHVVFGAFSGLTGNSHKDGGAKNPGEFRVRHVVAGTVGKKQAKRSEWFGVKVFSDLLRGNHDISMVSINMRREPAQSLTIAAQG